MDLSNIDVKSIVTTIEKDVNSETENMVTLHIRSKMDNGTDHNLLPSENFGILRVGDIDQFTISVNNDITKKGVYFLIIRVSPTLGFEGRIRCDSMDDAIIFATNIDHAVKEAMDYVYTSEDEENRLYKRFVDININVDCVNKKITIDELNSSYGIVEGESDEQS